MGEPHLDLAALAGASDRWVAAGVLTEAQRDAVLSIEQQRRPPPSAATRQIAGSDTEPVAAPPGPIGPTSGGGPEPPRPTIGATRDRTVPLALEIAGYLGVATAGAAAAFVIGQFWTDFDSAVQVLVLAAVTAALGGGAATISSTSDASVARLANLLWFLATGGVAWCTTLAAGELMGLSDSTLGLVVGLVTVAPAAALLWWRRATLQHLAAYAALMGVIGAGLDLVLPGDSADALAASVFWLVGIGWCVASSRDLLPHPNVGYALGAITALAATLGVADEYTTAGIWLAVVTSAALLAAGATTRSLVLVGVSLPGLFLSVLAALGHHIGFDEDNQMAITVALLIVGLGVLAGALVAARRVDHRRSVIGVPLPPDGNPGAT